jgi:diaminopimelate decarboxylase
MDSSMIYDVNDRGNMVLAGHDVQDLLAQFGSPLLVILEDVVRENCRAYVEGCSEYPRFHVHYAGKALLLTGLCRLLQEEGLGLDVVSWGELQTALRAGFPPEHILMHGNAKTMEDLRQALDAKIGRIVIDNEIEIDRLAQLTEERGLSGVKVFLRITPGIKPSTHSYVQTGQIDSKFGFNLTGGAAEEAARRVMAIPGLELVGLHCHIGSQIFEVEPFQLAADEMMKFYAHLKNELGAPLDELNLGGGLGIVYGPDDQAIPVREYLKMECEALLAASEKWGVAPPMLYKEPGRSIIGRAGVTLYTVESIKQIEGVRNYVSVNGGMTDNPRFALYQAKHEVLAASRMKEEASLTWTVSGRCCESGDLLQKDVKLPPLQADDVLALLSTGAYTYSMASHYNRVAKPAVVLAAPGRVECLARRETAVDLLGLDCIPSWLATSN